MGCIVTRVEEARHMDERRFVILVNDRAKLSRGKYAAQAVHAALLALGVHPEVPVIVLGASPTEIAKMRTQVRDAGRTEVEPGTLTAGTNWETEEGNGVPELTTGTHAPRECDDDLRRLVEKVNGFVYMGLTMNNTIKTVEVLRANPEFAKRLLGLE
jgi:PTH2 family peptidyl-tRNA hydrolase